MQNLIKPKSFSFSYNLLKIITMDNFFFSSHTDFDAFYSGYLLIPVQNQCSVFLPLSIMGSSIALKKKCS